MLLSDILHVKGREACYVDVNGDDEGARERTSSTSLSSKDHVLSSHTFFLINIWFKISLLLTNVLGSPHESGFAEETVNIVTPSETGKACG